MMKYLILALTILLSGCGSEAVAENNAALPPDRPPITEPPQPPLPTPPTPTMEATWTGFYSSWWERPQYYNGVPKYSGAFGTYTHKHIPVAIFGDGHLFHVRTDNTGDGNFYVYAMKDDVEVLVHTINNWDDPHTNAAITIDRYGYVEIHVASRGLDHKFQTGVVLKSQTPYELDFQCVDGCNAQQVNYEAYPQIHQTSWGQHLIFTRYDFIDGKNVRRTYSKLNGQVTRLSELAHYTVSNYDPHMDKLCVASNTLIASSPDNRVNLSLMCTSDGFGSWSKADNSLLDLNDEDGRIVYNSQGKFIYLKDITSVAGKVHVLFTESDTDDPTTGTRWLSQYVQGEGVTKIAQVGHNYSAGAYLKKDGELYIVAGKSNSTGYLSGNLELYDKDLNLIDTLEGDYSYVRKVSGIDAMAVMSEGTADLQTRGKHYTLELK